MKIFVKANAAIQRALAKHFGVSPSAVQLIFCRASLQKIFEINTN